METNSKLDELKVQIREQLEMCNAGETPFLCNACSTTEGKKMVAQMILKKVLYSTDNSIANAIVDAENEFNPNANKTE